MRNYKLLKYSWETDPKVKAWKDAREKWRTERRNSSKTFPLKIWPSSRTNLADI